MTQRKHGGEGERLVVPRPLTEADRPLVVRFCREWGIGSRHHQLVFRTFDALGRAFALDEFPPTIAQIFELAGFSNRSAPYSAYSGRRLTFSREQAARLHQLALDSWFVRAARKMQIDVVETSRGSSNAGWALKAGLVLPNVGVVPSEIGHALDRAACVSMIDRCIVTLRSAGFEGSVQSTNEGAVDMLLRSRALAQLPWIARVSRLWYPEPEFAGRWSADATAGPTSIADVLYSSRGSCNIMVIRDGRHLLAYGPSKLGRFYMSCFRNTPERSLKQTFDELISAVEQIEMRDGQLLDGFQSERLTVRSGGKSPDQYYLFTRMILGACGFELLRDPRADALRPRTSDGTDAAAGRDADDDTEHDAKEGR